MEPSNIELSSAADPGRPSQFWYEGTPRLTIKTRRQVQRFVRRLMSNTSYQYFISHAKNISTFLNRDGGQLLYPTCTQVSSGDECRPSIGAVVKQERATCTQVSFRNERRPICPSIYFSNCGSQSKNWSLLTWSSVAPPNQKPKEPRQTTLNRNRRKFRRQLQRFVMCLLFLILILQFLPFLGLRVF
jgi:hypothetical protein